MTKEIFVVAYEGGDDGGRVLDYAIARAAREDAALLIVHVLEWSPYKFLTAEELSERHARRKTEMIRAEEAILAPAVAKAAAAGVGAETWMHYGSVPELVVKKAAEIGASAIFVGRSGANSIEARIFGSVPLAIAQIATVPTIIVP